MKSFKSIPLKLKCEPITIKEPYKPEVKEFADTEEFTCYFRENEDAFKEPSNDPEKPVKFLTTNKLNRTYKIPGYRIRIINKGKDNEELTLVKDYYTRTNDSETTNECLNEPSDDKFVEIEQQITDILERINNIESFLCQLKR